MKYVKAHKETLRPFRKEGGEEKGGACCRKLGIVTASAEMRKKGKKKLAKKPCRYALARTSQTRWER